MAEGFKGTIDVDIRDSTPDWDPYMQPMAREGAPNVLYIVLDDVGFSAIGCYRSAHEPLCDIVKIALCKCTRAREARISFSSETRA